MTGSHDQNQNYEKSLSLQQSLLWMIRGRMTKVYDHIVVGAGINGSSTAYQLARRGEEVLVLEKVSLLSHILALIQLFISSSRSLTLVAALMDKAEVSGRLTPTPTSPTSWRRLTRSGTP